MPIIPEPNALKLNEENRYKAYINRKEFKSIFAFFSPDCIDNISHDAPDDYDMTVYDYNGIPIFGRICNNPKGKWQAQLKNYIWKD